MRAPLLPAELLPALASPEVSEALSVTADPIVREALYIASPSLSARIPSDSRGSFTRPIEEATIRYLLRAASRPTPFGLFASVSTGTVARHTQLHVPPRATLRRHSRIDMEVLSAIAARLRACPIARSGLSFVPNDALYDAGDELRLPVSSTDGLAQRSFHYEAITATSVLRQLLTYCAPGRSFVEIRDMLRRLGYEEVVASRFLHTLIDVELLVPRLGPHLDRASHSNDFGPASPVVADAEAVLAELDREGPGVAPETYERIAASLSTVAGPVQPGRLVHVDAYRRADGLTLGSNVVNEVARAVELLSRLQPPPSPNTSLARFTARFVERYEGEEVPLLEALDPDRGIGFDADSSQEDRVALLDSLPVEASSTAQDTRSALLRSHAPGPRIVEWELTDDDVRVLSYQSQPTLSRTVFALASVAATSARAVDRNEFEVRILHATASPSAQLLGRFCHADDELRERVAAMLQNDQVSEPDVVYAEVFHCPEGRHGNVISRPLLGRPALTYLGTVSEGLNRIAAQDLLVSVNGGEVILRSRHTGTRVVPTMSCAHNFQVSQLPAYRFLAALADPRGPVTFPWGDAARAPFTPRVCRGRAVLELATWRFVGQKLFAELTARDGGLRAMDRYALPPWVVLVDGDNTLPIHLRSERSVNLLARFSRTRSTVELQELWPTLDKLVASGPEGAFFHELVIPLSARAARRAEPSELHVDTEKPVEVISSTRLDDSTAVVRRFAPGSEWLFAKIYAGSHELDQIVSRRLRDVVGRAREAGVTRWFFIRYADPHEHLRIRFHGEPALLTGAILPSIHRTFAADLESRRVWRIELGTYTREVERYGGPKCIETAEAVFEIDSDAVLEAIGDDDLGLERWEIALLGTRSFLDASRLSIERQITLLEQREPFDNGDSARDFDNFMSKASRRWKARANAMLEHPPQRPSALVDGYLGRLAGPLRMLRDGTQSDSHFEALVASLTHMHVNRVVATRARAQESVINRLLANWLRAKYARSRST